MVLGCGGTGMQRPGVMSGRIWIRQGGKWRLGPSGENLDSPVEAASVPQAGLRVAGLTGSGRGAVSRGGSFRRLGLFEFEAVCEDEFFNRAAALTFNLNGGRALPSRASK